MEKRRLGKTGLEVSLIGFGGFHLIEIPEDKAVKLLNTYLDSGGNYIETAADYGDGESERKIGKVAAERRDEMVLVSKTASRNREGAEKDLKRTLHNLQTDYLDLYIMHHVETKDTLNKILGPGGAMELVREAQKEGIIGNVGISMHGQPDILIDALKTDEFDAVMAVFNYFDKFNFPKLEDELLPLAQEKSIGVILMKALADGFLWQSAETAFRYAFSLPVDIVVTGMNNTEMLETDLEWANKYSPMSKQERHEWFAIAPELGNYICRQCDICSVSDKWGKKIKKVFKLEGYYDRQMYDGKPRNPAEFALRDRLRFWFGNQKIATKIYTQLTIKAADLLKEVKTLKPCRYGLPVKDKLEIIDYKLGESDTLQ